MVSVLAIATAALDADDITKLVERKHQMFAGRGSRGKAGDQVCLLQDEQHCIANCTMMPSPTQLTRRLPTRCISAQRLRPCSYTHVRGR